MSKINKQALALAQRTSDAYSYDRYRSWNAVCAWLLKQGWSEEQAEEILRSKYMRWAADRCNGDKASVNHLATFMVQNDGSSIMLEVGLPAKPDGHRVKVFLVDVQFRLCAGSQARAEEVIEKLTATLRGVDVISIEADEVPEE